MAGNHHLLLGSLSLSLQLQDIRKRLESKQAPRSRTSVSVGKGRILSSLSSTSRVDDAATSNLDQDRDRLMQIGEEELMKLIQNGLQLEVHAREHENLVPISYLQEGWGIMDAFFVQVRDPFVI